MSTAQFLAILLLWSLVVDLGQWVHLPRASVERRGDFLVRAILGLIYPILIGILMAIMHAWHDDTFEVTQGILFAGLAFSIAFVLALGWVIFESVRTIRWLRGRHVLDGN